MRDLLTADRSVEVRELGEQPDGDLKDALDGVGSLIHLAAGAPRTPTGATTDVETTRRLLDAAGDASVEHLVLLSDATVYGAWPNNPVPLTERAVLRPNPGFTWASERAELERLAAEWRDAHPGTTVTILRPARTPGRTDWLIRALRPAPAVPELAVEPPVQFLALDDLASAVALAREQRLDGAYNVAPDEVITGEEVRSLTGAPPRVRLPEQLAHRFADWRFRSGLGPTPPELVPYTLHPWVVACDGLRAAGWRATMTSEEAAVESHDVGPWATLSPRRRQEVALGVAGVGLAGLAAGGAWALRRWLARD
ncbi:MAG TPA: NAD-dependent epimerase/dehydratase family protein [Acidimicrobiales bacterium]